jgi:hypothetical protein
LEINQEKKRNNGHNIADRFPANNRIKYIELLLKMPLKDYPKSAISLILALYFMDVQGLSDADSFDRIREWVESNEVKALEPSLAYFDELINNGDHDHDPYRHSGTA